MVRSMKVCIVAVNVGRIRSLSRYTAYACQIAASSSRSTILRSQAWPVMRSHGVNATWTTPMSCSCTCGRMYSGRCTISGTDILHRLDPIREQRPVDALGQALAGGRVGPVFAVAVELALHLARVRRQQQDAAADAHRLRDRMGDEHDGE